MKKILLIGGGGREHTIAYAISKSERPYQLYAVMSKKNPGIANLCNDLLINSEVEIEIIVQYATRIGIDIAIIGPEAPLAVGLADALENAGIPAIGPKRLAAKLEFDKAWTRKFMERNNISGLPAFGIFNKQEENEAHQYIEELGDVAVKPAGLTGGKGVKVMGDQLPDKDAAKAYASELLKSDVIVIEENLKGEEVTIQAFVDGKHLAFAPSVQDHKRAFEGDLGPNTGGMGSYNDAGYLLPFMIESDYTQAKEIMEQVVRKIKEETMEEYRGILYGQFILTTGGIKVIEFNARFGDPEVMNILPLLETDIIDIIEAMTTQTLDTVDVRFSSKATVCKYCVPAGYPEDPVKDAPIEVGDMGDAILFYSSVYEKEGVVYTTGSRAAAVVGIANSIQEAEKIAQAALTNIKGPLECRQDIGKQLLIQKRIDHMQSLRG
ncbi:MAG: phosphoribosylamine--glycine ligase [Candidatus Methanomarinus sp.]|nr:MAG: phosphoribosylamine--glycine ligase [ANME-2 cluster archaeon]